MKKKYRDIVVDDEAWGWRFNVKPSDYYGIQSLSIWKNKKIIFEKAYRYNRDRKTYKIRPSLIASFIKRYLNK